MSRLRLAVGLVASVFVVGVIGYRAHGLTWTESAYQTVTTVTTVGYRELGEFGPGMQWFTMFIIVTGVSTVLYTFTLVVQVVVEGQLVDFLGRRRMDRRISEMRGHVVVCGWGRVGRSVVADLVAGGREVVIVDRDESRTRDVPHATITGDATIDATLRAAGVEHASALVAALEGDADNLFVTLSARAINPDLFIVARARADESIAKLTRAGADRVVNPQELGAARMASFVTEPNVAEFVDVVMHDRALDFRLHEVPVPENSPLAGRTLREADLRARANVLVLALRGGSNTFVTNPDPETVIEPGSVIIAIGTSGDLHSLREATA